MVNFLQKKKYNVADLVEIMRLLRGKNGCPWDREQTHESIRMNFIEEVYEACEAIDNHDTELLREELGDVLAQVVFHSEMEREIGSFDIDDVADGVCKKFIERHPHIFGDVTVSGTDEVLTNWDDIKRNQKGHETHYAAMDSVARSLPSLMRAEKLQAKARKAGFDWEDISGAFDKLDEEIAELKSALGNPNEEFEELGDVLFTVVNIARFLKINPEESLDASNEKFLSRFKITEQIALEEHLDMNTMSIDRLDALWERAKIRSKGSGK